MNYKDHPLRLVFSLIIPGVEAFKPRQAKQGVALQHKRGVQQRGKNVTFLRKETSFECLTFLHPLQILARHRSAAFSMKLTKTGLRLL